MKQRINLIKESAQYLDFKTWAFYVRIALSSIMIILFVVYATILINTFFVQDKLNQLTASLATPAFQQGPQSAKALAETSFGLAKLKTIREVFIGSPEYYKQYQYLLKKIADFLEDFSIEELSFDKSGNVSLSVNTAQVTELLAFIEDFNAKEVSGNFNTIEVSSVAFFKQQAGRSATASASISSTGEDRYRVTLRLQFTDKFNETVI